MVPSESSSSKHRHAGSCNPPRRAKGIPSTATPAGGDIVPPTAASVSVARPVPILPKPTPSTKRTMTVVSEESGDDSEYALPAPAPKPPAKRGRKPGPLSRAQREAQRRLNHSIIEKARRTKINEALATLRQLVPTDAGPTTKQGAAESDEENDDDDEFQPGNGASKPTKKAAKKEGHEKEFKLEILVRTVAYMKHLIARVDELEGSSQQEKPSDRAARPVASNPSDQLPPASVSKKRPRPRDDSVEEDMSPPSRRKPAPRDPSYNSPPTWLMALATSPQPATHTHTRTTLPPHSTSSSGARHSPPHPGLLDGPLPPISSWLPKELGVATGARISPPHDYSQSIISRSPAESYLPSPPSSTTFDPVKPTHVPPILNLGSPSIQPIPSPTASPTTSYMSGTTTTTTTTTTEDESAAVLLLQMAATHRSTARHHAGESGEPPRHVQGQHQYGLGRPLRGNDIFSISDPETTNVGSPSNGRPRPETPASLLGIRYLVR